MTTKQPIWKRILSSFIAVSLLLGDASALWAQSLNTSGDIQSEKSYITSDSGTQTSFQAALQSSLIPERNYGSGTPSFVRTTAAAHTDFEGIIRQVPAGAARFQGARYVRNVYLGSSEDFGNASWNVGTPTATGGVGVITFSGAGNDFRLQSGATIGVLAGHTYVISATIQAGTKAGTIKFGNQTGGIYATITPTAQAKRYSFSFVATASAFTGFVNGDANAGTVLVSNAMLEDVTGQANQNPSEYVPALATANADSGAIGVRYFPYLNGNTVASNVVTEAQGALITSAQSAAAGGVTAKVVDANGPLGYLAEGVRTNLALQSQTLGTTWAVSNAADMEAVSADQYVVQDGTTTADKLQTKATNSTHYLQQAFTYSAAVHTFSGYLRFVTPQRWVALTMDDGTTTRACSYDLQTGAVGAVSGATSTIAATGLANVYRVTCTGSAAFLAAAGKMTISINNSDSASNQSWNAAGTELLGAWGMQLEAASFASSYIPTTTVAVQRNADVLTYASAGNISGTQGSVYAEITTATPAGTYISILDGYAGGAGGNPFYVRAADNKLTINDAGTERLFGAVTRSATTPQKLAIGWGNSAANGAVNGTVAVATAFSGNLALEATLGIGVRGPTPTVGNLFGTIRNVRIYHKALSASQLQAFTTTAAANDEFYYPDWFDLPEWTKLAANF